MIIKPRSKMPRLILFVCPVGTRCKDDDCVHSPPPGCNILIHRLKYCTLSTLIILETPYLQALRPAQYPHNNMREEKVNVLVCI